MWYEEEKKPKLTMLYNKKKIVLCSGLLVAKPKPLLEVQRFAVGAPVGPLFFDMYVYWSVFFLFHFLPIISVSILIGLIFVAF